MEEIVKKELKTTSKKAVASGGLWIAVLALVCCGGPIILLALLSGGVTGLFGVLTSSLFLFAVGVLVSLLAIIWLVRKTKGG